MSIKNRISNAHKLQHQPHTLIRLQINRYICHRKFKLRLNILQTRQSTHRQSHRLITHRNLLSLEKITLSFSKPNPHPYKLILQLQSTQYYPKSILPNRLHIYIISHRTIQPTTFIFTTNSRIARRTIIIITRICFVTTSYGPCAPGSW